MECFIPATAKRETRLNPASLFSTALWFHNTLALQFGVGVNIFWRHLPADSYDKKDPYGNKDPVAATRALQALERALHTLDELPAEYRDFYGRRMIQRVQKRTYCDGKIDAEQNSTLPSSPFTKPGWVLRHVKYPVKQHCFAQRGGRLLIVWLCVVYKKLKLELKNETVHRGNMDAAHLFIPLIKLKDWMERGVATSEWQLTAWPCLWWYMKRDKILCKSLEPTLIFCF